MKHLKFSFWVFLFLFALGSVLSLVGLFFSAYTDRINPFLIFGPLLLILNLTSLLYAEYKLRLKKFGKSEGADTIISRLPIQLRPLQLGLIIAMLAELVVGLLLTSIAPTMTYSYITSFLCCLICFQLILYIVTLVLYRNKT